MKEMEKAFGVQIVREDTQVGAERMMMYVAFLGGKGTCLPREVVARAHSLDRLETHLRRWKYSNPRAEAFA